MLGRVIIAIIGAGFAIYCVITAFLTYFEKNPATLHLTNFYLVGYAAINAVLTPFGLSGIVGGLSRKKSLIKAFTRFQWWLATCILVGLSVFNVILSKNGKKDFIRRCQISFAKIQPESDFLARCTAMVNDAEKATFIAACSQGGIMIILGIILVIIGTRVYSSISLEEETKNLLEKANFSESDERDDVMRSPTTLQRKPDDINNNGGDVDDVMNINYGPNVGTFIPDQYDIGRYSPNNVTNVRRQPSNAAINVELTRRPTNAKTMNVIQHSGLRRHPTDPSSTHLHAVIARNKTEPNYMPPSYTGLARLPTNPGNVPSKGYNGLARYPTNSSNISANRGNMTRQPTIGNAYVQRNYVGAPQATYPIVPQRSLSTKRYVSPPPSYVISPKQTLIGNQNIQNIVPMSKVNEYNEYDEYGENINDYDDPYDFHTKSTAPRLVRMGIH